MDGGEDITEQIFGHGSGCLSGEGSGVLLPSPIIVYYSNINNVNETVNGSF